MRRKENLKILKQSTKNLLASNTCQQHTNPLNYQVPNNATHKLKVLKISRSHQRKTKESQESTNKEEDITLMDSIYLPLGIPTPPPLSGFFAGIILPCPSSSSSPHPQQRCMLEGRIPQLWAPVFPQLWAPVFRQCLGFSHDGK